MSWARVRLREQSAIPLPHCPIGVAAAKWPRGRARRHREERNPVWRLAVNARVAMCRMSVQPRSSSVRGIAPAVCRFKIPWRFPEGVLRPSAY